MPSVNYIRLIFILGIGFIIATIIGTISHEAGHYLVARALGHPAELHFAFTRSYATMSSDRLLIALGGPAQTIITGTIGFLFLRLARRSPASTTRLTLGEWVLVFMAFFWSRQIVIFLIGLFNFFIHERIPLRGDEYRLSRYLNLPWWCIAGITALIAVAILYWIIFRIIPGKQRLPFIIAGILGSIAGYFLWMTWLGPALLP